MLPIPGTGDPEHLADNMKRAGLGLDEAELDALDRRSRQAWDAARTT